MPTSAPPNLRHGSSLESGRTDLAERRVAAALVVERLDVVEQLHLGLTEAPKAIGELRLQRREEAFHHRIIVTIPASTHAARDAVRLEHRLVVLGRIGAALIRVM